MYMTQQLKRSLIRANNLMRHFGIHPSKIYTSFRGIPAFTKDYFELKRQISTFQSDFHIGRLLPILHERFAQSGTASGHYFHQDLLVAKRVFQNNPVKHVDIGSRIDGFVAHVASFRKIEVFDIRDLDSQIPNIYFKRADICSKEFDLVDYCDSVSSLHVIEHLGLGRYGDKVDCNSHLKGLNNIYSLLKTGGKFYFSVPIGEQRIEFNAHRVFSVKYLLNILEGRYNIDSFSYVDDGGDLFKDVRLNSDEIENNYSCIYGCGIFELTKV
jgi:SAM-dependent methyltransferase